MEESQRRLSPWRVFLALIVLAGLSAGAFFGWQRYQEVKADTNPKPWFAAYVDVTATPLFPIEQLDQSSSHTEVLSFIVSSSADACTPTWGGVYNLNQASANLDLDRRVARLRQQGGNVTVSFGGLRNNELSLNCTDPQKLQEAYQSVIDRYTIDTIDLDLEGGSLTNADTMKRRAGVLASLQKSKRANHKNLAVWLTLPVTPQGLAEDGTNAVAEMLKSGVDISGVNVMAMDYGNSLQNNESMGQAAQDALNETHRQLDVLYKQAGIPLSSDTLWEKIGVTPMIGQNDTAGEIFSLQDAALLNQFALSHGVGRMSMWSENRDLQCGDNYVDLKIVSDSCSGVKQDKSGFSKVLSQGFNGKLNESSAAITKANQNANIQPTDDPAISPYQIWQEEAVYLPQTKIVWHRNVYQAKWWTQGDIPDNPVLQSWQTPWQLLGPVLPGETPVPQPTLPPGTYPDWSGDKEYQAGDRVLLNGMPYQAKWWTKGDSPAQASINPDNSPWLAIPQSQFNELLKISTGSASPK